MGFGELLFYRTEPDTGIKIYIHMCMRGSLFPDFICQAEKPQGGKSGYQSFFDCVMVTPVFQRMVQGKLKSIPLDIGFTLF